MSDSTTTDPPEATITDKTWFKVSLWTALTLAGSIVGATLWTQTYLAEREKRQREEILTTARAERQADLAKLDREWRDKLEVKFDKIGDKLEGLIERLPPRR